MQSSSTASPKRRASRAPGMLLSVLLVLVVLPSRAASQCSAGNQCIRPQPMPASFALGEDQLSTALMALRCEMVCIKEYAPDAELINGNSLWPTYADFDFSENCGLYNKIQGCKLGCMEHFAVPDLTINRCRDSCYDKCEDPQQYVRTGQCPRDCRKTYCRFGCLLYDSFNTNNVSNQTQAALARPEVVPLQTTNTCARWQHAVTISLPASQNDSNHGTTTSAAQQPNPVTFLLKLSSQDGSFVRYIWQNTLNMSMNFASFACQQISLSYAVVSKSTSLSSLVFSPQTTVCVPGLAAYPSQVNQSSIHVEFSEDTRNGFFGYAVANLSWEASPDLDCVSSYQVNVYPDREECGGIAEREQPGIQFININRTFTSFIFRAREANGFMKFGCSYIFEVETLPVPSIQIGPRINRLAQLTAGPSMELQCKRVWSKDGHFNVSISVSLPGSAPSNHINRFRFYPTLQRNGQSIQTLDQDTLDIPQGNSSPFVKVLSTRFVPEGDNLHTMKIQVIADKNISYFWRSIPQFKECTVSMDPIPPDSVRDILVENVAYTSSTSRLNFDLSWTPPTPYGQLKDYDLIVLDSTDRDRLLSGASVDSLEPYHRQTLLPGLRNTAINASVHINSDTHCLYLKMRARNNFTLFSGWSSAVVLPLDGHCIVQPPSHPPTANPLTNVTSIPIDRDDDIPNSKISVFYEADDGNRVRLLDVGCEANPGASEQNIHNRLLGIESRVDAVLSQLNAEHEAFERLSHLQAKLNNIEQKLDALMALVTTHVYGHDS